MPEKIERYTEGAGFNMGEYHGTHLCLCLLLVMRAIPNLEFMNV